MIPVTTASDTASSGAYSTTGAIVGAPGNYTTFVDATFGALAEFERTLIRGRTQAGLAAARARGRKGGRRHSLDADRRALAVRLYEERQMPISRICAMMGISKPTLYAYVRAANGVTGDGPPAT